MFRNGRIWNLVFVVCVVLLNIETFYALPLIFKITKEVTATDLVDLGSFDTSKYRQVRVIVKQVNVL